MSESRRSSRHRENPVGGDPGYTTSSSFSDEEGEPSRHSSHEYGPSRAPVDDRWGQHYSDIDPSDSASASAEYDDRYHRRPQSARPRSSSRHHRLPSGRQSYTNFRAPIPPAMSSEPSDEFYDVPPFGGRGYAPPPPHGHAPFNYPGRGHPAATYAQSHVGAWPPSRPYGSSMVPFNMHPFSPISSNGGNYFDRSPYDMVPYHHPAPQSYYGGPGPGPGYGGHQLQQYMYGPPPAPPTEAPGPRSATPAAPAEKKVDPEVEAMKAKLELFEKERLRKEEEEQRKALEEKIRRDTEEALQRRMEDIRKAQEEAKKEIERAKADAERAARERIEAERKAEEERQRLHAEAMQRAERDAREKLQAELKAMEEKRKKDAEEEAERKRLHDEAIKKAEEAAKAKLEAEFKAAEEKKKAEAEAQARAEAEAKARLEAALRAAEEAKEAAAKKAAEEAEWKKKLQEEANLKAEVEARTKLENERKAAEEAAAAAEAKKKEEEALKKRLLDEAKADADEAQKKKEKEEKAPIKFKDAVGRKFSFPFHICKTWTGMEDLIKQAFLHVDVIGPHVQEGHYDLIGPNGEIILPSVWEKVIEPDASITMHMWPMEKAPLRGQMHASVPPGMGHPAGVRPSHPQHARPMQQPGMMGGMRPASARPAGTGGMGVPPPVPQQFMGMPGMGPPGGVPIRTGGAGMTPVVIDAVPPRKKSSSKSGASLMGWMAGKPAKSGTKKKHRQH